MKKKITVKDLEDILTKTNEILEGTDITIFCVFKAKGYGQWGFFSEESPQKAIMNYLNYIYSKNHDFYNYIIKNVGKVFKEDIIVNYESKTTYH